MKLNFHTFVVYAWIAGVLALLTVAVAAGLRLGRDSVPDYAPATVAEEKPAPKPVTGEVPPLPKEDAKKGTRVPPVYFAAGAASDAEWNVALEEISMASAAGVHQYILAIPLPWTGPKQLEEVTGLVAKVVAADPKARFYFRVNLNPPEAWMQAHPNDLASVNGQAPTFPCPASEDWRDETGRVLAALVAGMEIAPFHERILGYVLTALAERRWYVSGGFDRSEANQNGFRNWLRKRYATDSALQKAWSQTGLTFDAVRIPDKPEAGDTRHVFLAFPEMQSVSDYLRYASEVTVEAVEHFAGLVKSVSESGTMVLVPYGFSFELTGNDAGHFELQALMDGPVDGFISPISYEDRGLGGSGGMMGPVDSVLAHGKQWLLLDDTRTGMTRDASTGEIARLKGLRAEDIYNVQRRNFTAALMHRIGIVWSDPMGEGWLHDLEQWDRLGQMRTIYAHVLEDDARGQEKGDEKAAGAPPAAAPEKKEETPVQAEGEGGTDGETDAKAAEEMPNVPSSLMVVVDEHSRFYQQCETPLNNLLLLNARDTALKAGLPTRFCLLRDVIGGQVESSPVYLFVNAFQLSKEDREKLHARLAQEKAIALWLYAPGLFDAGQDKDNVAATTGMNIVAFSGGGDTGSQFMLDGRWMKENQAYGETLPMNPLFHIDDAGSDMLAKYRASGKVSVAMKPQDSGWTSVFFADPNLTPELLRETLRLFEQHLFIGPSDHNFFDTIHANGDLLAIHARQMGERVVVLGEFCNVEDLFDSANGWQEKQSFYLPMKAGETRLFKLSPP